MLDINSWQSKKALRTKLLNFLAEMEKNLEIYYVMDQRQFITTGFLMDNWARVKEVDFIKRQEYISAYAESLVTFNTAFEEQKAFEKWYSSDINHKTQENAKKLHALKHDLTERIKVLEPIIILAGQALEKELLNLGFITN
jgi:hypothetical protein